MSEMSKDKRVGVVIQNRRLELGISQGELADRLRHADVNWSQGTLSRVELGERPVRLVEAAVVAEVLEIDIRRLLQAEKSPVERVLEQHRIARESVQDLMTAMTRTYNQAEEVKEILEADPNLWEALENAWNPRPDNPSDYPSWLAGLIARMPVTGDPNSFGGLGVNEFGPPHPVETREEAQALMSIPRAVISRSVGVWVGDADAGSWEPVPEGDREDKNDGE